MMSEIFLRKLIHLDTDLFISIMFELRCTKFGIVHKTMVDPLKMPLDESLSQIMDNIMLSLWCSFPISVAMRSSSRSLELREKVQCLLDDASVGCTFFQEMPASAIDDALTPVQKAFFALRLRVRLEQFKQLHVVHVLNHFLWHHTGRVVGYILL